MKNEEDLNKKTPSEKIEGCNMAYVYGTYKEAARHRRSGEVTVYDDYEGGWKNIKSPFSIRRRIKRGFYW